MFTGASQFALVGVIGAGGSVGGGAVVLAFRAGGDPAPVRGRPRRRLWLLSLPRSAGVALSALGRGADSPPRHAGRSASSRSELAGWGVALTKCCGQDYSLAS